MAYEVIIKMIEVNIKFFDILAKKAVREYEIHFPKIKAYVEQYDEVTLQRDPEIRRLINQLREDQEENYDKINEEILEMKREYEINNPPEDT